MSRASVQSQLGSPRMVFLAHIAQRAARDGARDVARFLAVGEKFIALRRRRSEISGQTQTAQSLRARLAAFDAGRLSRDALSALHVLATEQHVQSGRALRGARREAMIEAQSGKTSDPDLPGEIDRDEGTEHSPREDEGSTTRQLEEQPEDEEDEWNDRDESQGEERRHLRELTVERFENFSETLLDGFFIGDRDLVHRLTQSGSADTLCLLGL